MSIKSRRWIRAALLLACLAIAAGAWFLHNLPERPVAIRVATPQFRDVTDLVTTNGTVEPVTEFQARANFPGIIGSVPVQLGDTVHPGELLVTMKDPYANSRLATAASGVAGATESDQNILHGGSQEERQGINADLEHAKLARDDAQKSLNLLQQLQQQGAAGKGEVDAAQRRLDDANVTLQLLDQRDTKRYSPAAIQAARARLQDAAAALGAAKIAFDNANIRAPIGGTVYSVSVAPYDFVPMGADLLRVTDLNRMQVRAFFDEPEVGKLHEGQDVTITWDGRPGRVWHGHIRKAPVAALPQADRSVAECIIKLDDSNGDLLPNTHVLVTVPIEVHRHVLTIPRQALQTEPNGNSVFRVIDGKLVRTPINIGLVDLQLVEVTSGLSPSDVVAVQALDEQPLSANLRVQAGN
jgi:HlyD family secretion protein